MKKVKIVMAFLLILTVFITGCLGGGEDGETNPPEYVEAKGTTGAEGNVETLAQAQPETVTETIDISIPESNITGLDIVVKVADGDDGTNPDEVSGSLDSTGEGGHNETLPQGNTPYTRTININAQEGRSLPTSWTLTLTVVCYASTDRWPGPGFWIGTPDNGFSYNVTVTYTYLKLAE